MQRPPRPRPVTFRPRPEPLEPRALLATLTPADGPPVPAIPGAAATVAGPAIEGQAPRGLVNPPVLTRITRAGGFLTAVGTLNSTPNATFVVAVYGTETPDPSGHGPGTTLLGSLTVMTDNAGVAGFGLKARSTATYLTATAATKGTTSGFALDTPPLVIGQSSSTTAVVGGQSISYFVTVQNKGAVDLPGVVVTDPLFPGATSPVVTTSRGTAVVAGGVATYTLGTIPTGGTATLTLTENVTVFGGVVNVARADFPGGVRLVSQSAPYAVNGDYDGDGKADPAIYVVGSAVFAYRPSSSGGGGGSDVVQTFGPPGASQAIPGDYGGESKDQPAVFLPGQALWAYRPSDGSGDILQTFGPNAGQSIPVPGDYDGSGRTELAVYIPAEGKFAYRPARGGPDVVIPFGTPNLSIFVPGDYDGSGRTEPAVFNPDTATFIYRPAGGGRDVIQQFGPGGGKSVPIPGDYDGDGKTDLAVYIPDSGQFAYRPSGAPGGGADHVEAFGPGGGQAIAAPADYDGDGRTDFAVYIPSTGVFAYRPSGAAGGGHDVVQPFGPGGGRTTPVLKAAGYGVPPGTPRSIRDEMPGVGVAREPALASGPRPAAAGSSPRRGPDASPIIRRPARPPVAATPTSTKAGTS